MKLTKSQVNKYNKLANKGKHVTIDTDRHGTLVWEEGDYGYRSIFASDNDGKEVEIDFNNVVRVNEEKIMKLTKSKLKEMVKEVLSEEDKLDLNKSYGVFLRGGSIGSGKGQYIDIKTGAKLLYTFNSESEAKARAKRSNKRLSPGEKKYYGMRYTAVKMSSVKNRLKKS